ncbi:MAG: TIGR00282 family metallophosphoesterase [bacterium]
MKILFIGDIIGQGGRTVVRRLLPEIIRDYKIDFCIANGENAAGGLGITPQIAQQLLEEKIDVLTSGNHIWDKKDILDFISTERRLLRPANYPKAPGHSAEVYTTGDGEKVGVLNLSGRVYMAPLDCPFRTAVSKTSELQRECTTIIVDFHAEATSEKQAMGWYLDGEVSAVIGTHTHVQTADATILPKGTAYITDAGMTGPFDSVIGVEKDIAIQKFLTQMPYKFQVAKTDLRLNGVVIDVESNTGLARNIQRLQISM